MTNNSRDEVGPSAIKSLVPKVSVCTGTAILTDTQRNLVPVVNSVNSSNVGGSALRVYIYIYIYIDITLKLCVSKL